jgi:hypothetical protein
MVLIVSVDTNEQDLQNCQIRFQKCMLHFSISN